jgi:hypothetical protein
MKVCLYKTKTLIYDKCIYKFLNYFGKFSCSTYSTNHDTNSIINLKRERFRFNNYMELRLINTQISHQKREKEKTKGIESLQLLPKPPASKFVFGQILFSVFWARPSRLSFHFTFLLPCNLFLSN